MQRARPILLVAALLLAGCLEEPGVTPISEEPATTEHATPVAPSVAVPTVEDLLDNVTDTLNETDEPDDEQDEAKPTNETVEPEERDVLFEGSAQAGADFVVIEMPEGYAEVGLRVLANGTLAGEVRLRDPNGQVVASCDTSCDAAFTGTIVPGEWVVLFPADALDVEVRVVGRVDATPPPPPLPETTRHLVYEHTQDLSAHMPGMRDTFALVEGYDRLVLDVKLNHPASGFEILLHDPAGTERGRCDGEETTCTLEVPSPAAGRWLLRYGANAPARATVAARGLAADVDYPNNVTAFDVDFSHPTTPGRNYTYGFFVTGPYHGLHFFPDIRGTGSAYVTLFDPEGGARAVCSATWNETACPTSHVASQGRWSVVMHGVGPAESGVNVWLAPDAPRGPAPPPGDGPGEPYVAYEKTFTFSGPANRTDRISVTSTAARLTGTIALDVGYYDDAAVEIRDPGWDVIFRCAGARECAVDLPLTWSQPHYVLYVGSGSGSAAVELTYSEEIATRPEAGMNFQAYAGAHNYHSWGDRRGTFADGFTVPPDWTRVVANVYFDKVGLDDESATARVTLVAPDGSDAASCARPARSCELEVAEAAPGMWEVRYEGLDASTNARVYVGVHAA